MEGATALNSLSPMPDAAEILLESDIQRLGRSLHQRLKGKTPSLFDAAYWQELLLE